MGAGECAREAIRISGGWATIESDFETLACVSATVQATRVEQISG